MKQGEKVLLIQDLKEAQALVAGGAWCQGAAARDRQGKKVPARSEDSVAYDVMGAVDVTMSHSHWVNFWRAYWLLSRVIPGLWEYGLIAYNDGKDRTIDEMVDLFGRAISRLEGNL